MRKIILYLIVGAMMTAGCNAATKPEPVATPVQERPVATPRPEKPTPSSPELCRKASGETPNGPAITVASSSGSVDYATFPGYTSQSATCEAVVGGGEIRGWVHVPPDTDETAAKSALSVDGGVITYTTWDAGSRVLHFQLADAANGSMQVIRFGEGLSMSLKRDWPTVAVDIRPSGSQWSPLDSLRTYPPGSYSLRFHFSAPVEKQRLENQLVSNKAGASWQWMDAQTLEVSLPTAPPKFELHPGGMADQRGIGTWAGPAVLHTGEPATLVAVDPKTGQESTLGTLPPEVNDALPSPDGSRMALRIMQPAPEQYWNGWMARNFVLDLKTGNLTPLDFNFTRWSGTRLLGVLHQNLVAWNPADGKTRQVASVPAYEVSPDGRYAVGLMLDYSREDQVTQLAPKGLVVVDLTTDKEQRFLDIAQHWVCHCDGRMTTDFYELWEGDLFYLKDDRSATEGTWLAVNVHTGEVNSAGPGKPRKLTAEERMTGPGGYRLQGGSNWAAQALIRPDGSLVKNLGPALPAGWMPDGRALFVRWPGHKNRFQQVYGL